MKTGVSYFGNRIPRHVKEDMHDILSHHCNFVVHTFSENDLQFYQETIREIVTSCHGAGLEVYLDPWGVGGIFGGEAYTAFVARNPDARQVRQDGAFAPVACPNHPKLRAFIKDWIQAAVSMNPQVIFWDEPHFYIPGWFGDTPGWACHCSICQHMFSEQYNHPIPKDKTDEVIAFQHRALYEFLKEMCEAVKAANPKVKNAICVLPSENTDHWEPLVKLDAVDIFGTDPYWTWSNKDVKEYVGLYSSIIAGYAKQYQKEGQIWVQAFRIPRGTEKNVGLAIDTAYNHGIRNIVAWGYEGCSCMSHIACDNPTLVWEIIGEHYQRLYTL
jgi:hypothetical protein